MASVAAKNQGPQDGEMRSEIRDHDGASLLFQNTLKIHRMCSLLLPFFTLLHGISPLSGDNLCFSVSPDYIFIFTYYLPLISFLGIHPMGSQFLDLVWQPALMMDAILDHIQT
ncbi:hypothetical protein M422DRAFT_260170 [Sphaerobolus stellatus SS14]|uniref:Uncharacterized protein n=1 Tax=Sphaerobolus stellatus (strain SS14) TaxID=990650 RepID=A0A0C9U3Q9_SPHS4|nr:hypothetical protein M422DRAFT_260170 [Sphaerobolus stellatus SS14]